MGMPHDLYVYGVCFVLTARSHIDLLAQCRDSRVPIASGWKLSLPQDGEVPPSLPPSLPPYAIDCLGYDGNRGEVHQRFGDLWLISQTHLPIRDYSMDLVEEIMDLGLQLSRLTTGPRRGASSCQAWWLPAIPLSLVVVSI